jgi:CheY-like chemotaxis protein
VPVETVRESANGHKSGGDANHKLNGIRVLIVDDDADTCEMLIYVLSHWGAETQASASVAEALKTVKDWEPDILLTDINMPGEDGYALISQLRTTKPGANIPVIALTAMARPEDGKRALSAGFQLHLAKPIDIDELAGAIMRLTEKSNLLNL